MQWDGWIKQFDKSTNLAKACITRKDFLIMKDTFNPDNDGFDPSEEYFKKKGDKYENETEEYFPQETSKPPHY